MIRYYTNVEHRAVYRFNNGKPEYYDLALGKWADYPLLWGTFIGELDVDDLTEDEAHELIIFALLNDCIGAAVRGNDCSCT